jgi:hypothetical protein
MNLQVIEKIGHRITVDINTGCWLWNGAKTQGGYATVYVDGRLTSGHRFMFEQITGAIPESYELDHKCSVRHCINPDHLEPVLHKENIRRGAGPMFRNGLCQRGHVIAETGVHISGKHQRCLACRKLRDALSSGVTAWEDRDE